VSIVDPSEAAAVAVRAGLCGAIAPNGFVCTRWHDHPLDEHRASAVGGPEDGHIYEVWLAS
jgi:hypothetical protein